MTKPWFNSSIRIPCTPHKAPRNLDQRLQNADAAWQDFIFAQRQMQEGECVEKSYAALAAFSRFSLELIDDRELRGLFLKNFETYLLQAGILHLKVRQ